jgi:hypothetical protein
LRWSRLDQDAIAAHPLALELDTIERMIMQAEGRCNTALREIDRRGEVVRGDAEFLTKHGHRRMKLRAGG